MTELTPQLIEEMDFETAFATLQVNVSQLEKEDLPLDKALQLYEWGQLLAKRCATLLEEAELKVRALSMDNASFDETES